MRFQTNSNADSECRYAKLRRRSLVTSLALLALLLVYFPRAEAQLIFDHEEFVFDQIDVVTGTAKFQTVLTGHLLDGEFADLVVVHMDTAGQRHLRIYAYDDDNWTLTLDTTIASEITFLDVVNIAGQDRLIAYEAGRLFWFDPESGLERPLVEVSSNFKVLLENEIPHVDITNDVNGDALDDLLVPDIDGFWVIVQLSDGVFADPVKIGTATDMSGIYGADGYRYDPWSHSKIHEIDYNFDGLRDLVYWRSDHFEVHTQDERGRFAPTAQRFTTEVNFESDNLYSLATVQAQGSVLHSLGDLNGDSISDLVVYSLSGQEISDKQSVFNVYFGARTDDNETRFSSEPGITFHTNDKIQLGMDLYDFDSDGDLDVMLTTIAAGYLERNFFKRMGRKLGGQSMSFGIMGDDIWLDIEFYTMVDGVFSATPNTTRRIALDGVPSHTEPGWIPLDIALRGATHERRISQETWQRAFNMILLVGDVNGDKYSDLFIGKNTPNGLDIFLGVPTPELFAPQGLDVASLPDGTENTQLVAATNDEEFAWLVDVNNDGKQDILMHHRFILRNAHGAPLQPLGSESQRVTVLIAR